VSGPAGKMPVLEAQPPRAAHTAIHQIRIF
jgi:hypothetical protein